MLSVRYFISRLGLHTRGLIASCDTHFNKRNGSGQRSVIHAITSSKRDKLCGEEASLGLHDHEEQRAAEAVKRKLLALNNGCMYEIT